MYPWHRVDDSDKSPAERLVVRKFQEKMSPHVEALFLKPSVPEKSPGLASLLVDPPSDVEP